MPDTRESEGAADHMVSGQQLRTKSLNFQSKKHGAGKREAVFTQHRAPTWINFLRKE